MRTITAAALVAALASAGVASAAEAPVVSSQATYRGATAPVTVPGNDLRRGERIPRGARLIYRSVALEGDQTARLSLRAPAGTTLRGLASGEGNPLSFTVIAPREYVGRPPREPARVRGARP